VQERGQSERGQLEHLLQPTLSVTRAVSPIYSTRAGFIVAFFGSGFASVIMTLLNVRRLGRLSQDLAMVVAGALFFTLVYVGSGYLAATGGSLPLVGEVKTHQREVRYLLRGLALAYFGLTYLRHQRFYRAQDLAGNDPPSPWVAGIAACVAAVALSFAFGSLGAWLGAR